MINIIFKDEEYIKKKFNRSVWILLTVSDKAGYHKIALKKDLFKKNYKVIYVLNGQTHIEKKEILLEELGNQIIRIDNLGRLYIENISVGLICPIKVVEKEEKIYSKIADRATKTVKNSYGEELKKQKEKFQNLQDAMKYVQKYYTIDKVKRLLDLQKNLVFGVVSCDNWQTVNKESNLKYKKNHDIKFIIDRMQLISKEMDCPSFINNRLMNLYEEISKLFEKLKEEKYSESTVSNIQVLYVFFAEELGMRTLQMCQYIRLNRIDTEQFKYNKEINSDLGVNQFEKSELNREVEKIDDYFNKIIEGICEFVERVTQQNIREEIEYQLRGENSKVLKKLQKNT